VAQAFLLVLVAQAFLPVLVAQAFLPVSSPLAGCSRDETGHLRYILGLPGSFILSAPVRSEVLSVGCSEDLILVKTADALERLDREGRTIRRWPAPAGDALFGFGQEPRSWVVYFPLTSQSYLATGDELRPLALDLGAWGEDVLAVALTGQDEAAVVVRTAGGLRWLKVSLSGDHVREDRELAGAVAPVLVLRDGAIVWGAGEDLVVQAPNGTQRRASLPAPLTQVELMREGWIRLKLSRGAGSLAVRLLQGQDELYGLPEAAR
jgi:hypothetical protein